MPINKYEVNLGHSDGCSGVNNGCRSNISDLCCFLYIIVSIARLFHTTKATIFIFSDKGANEHKIASALSAQFIESRVFLIDRIPSDDKLMKAVDTKLFFVWWKMKESNYSESIKLLNRMATIELLKPPRIWLLASDVTVNPTILMKEVRLKPSSFVAVIQKSNSTIENEYSIRDIYAIDEYNSLNSQLIGELSLNKNIAIYKRIEKFPAVYRKLNNYTIRVAALRRPPFVDYDPKNNKLSGVLGEILIHTKNMFSLRYITHLTGEDEKTKNRDSLDELRTNNSDLLLGVLTKTKKRFFKYSSSHSVVYGRYEITFVRQKNGLVAADFIRIGGYTAPFTPPSWILILIFSLTVATILTLTQTSSIFSIKHNRIRMNNSRKKFSRKTWGKGGREICNSFITALFMAVGALLQKGSRNVPQDRASQVIWFSYFMFAVLIINNYTSKLVSLLTIHTAILPFKSINDLLDNTKYNIVAIVNSSSYYRYENAKHGLQLKIKNRIAKYVENSKEGTEYVFSHDYTVFIDHDVQVFPFLQNNCSFETIPFTFYYKHGFHLIFTKHHRIIRTFNYMIDMLSERGVMNKIVTDHLKWDSKAFCREKRAHTNASFNQVSYLVLTYLIGVIVAVIVFIVEYLAGKFFLKQNSFQC